MMERGENNEKGGILKYFNKVVCRKYCRIREKYLNLGADLTGEERGKCHLDLSGKLGD